MLLTYDIVGPMISYELAHDINGTIIAKTFFNEYITKAVSAIEEQKYNQAINIYKAMTNALGEHYHIDTGIIKLDINKVNMDTLGHARTKIKDY